MLTSVSDAVSKLTKTQPDIKKMQIQLTGFLDKDTAGFCKELWKLCLSAQSNPQGVPKELLEAKKLELIQEKVMLRCIPFTLSLCLIICRSKLKKQLRRPDEGAKKTSVGNAS
jgi:hypothetical protein